MVRKEGARKFKRDQKLRAATSWELYKFIRGTQLLITKFIFKTTDTSELWDTNVNFIQEILKNFRQWKED